MIIHFFGAAQTVTGSQCLLEINQQLLLLECGLYQGKRMESYERNLNFNFDISRLKAVILSHSHIDHSGNLPNLVKQGYTGRIYSTPPTVKLADIMLRDSGHVQEENVEYANFKRIRRGEPLMTPLYTAEDGARVLKYFSPVEYNEDFEPIQGVRAHLVDAGHILGSSAIVLDVQENGRKFRFWYSGDIGRIALPILKDPVVPSGTDFLVMECTYGDKQHRDPDAAYGELRDVINRTYKRGGRIVIPSFAVGRTQELVYDLNQMISRREIPRIPVFVDSPLAVNASNIFREMEDSPDYRRYFDQETLQFMNNGQREVFNFPGLTYTNSVEESKKLNERRDTIIIISASGMAETGRVLHHIRWSIEDPRSTIVIVSWQAPDTLGRRLADREQKIKIFGDVYDRKAEVVTIGGLSAHAGQDFLLQYARSSEKQLKQIYLIHSEPKIANIFQQKLRQLTDVPVAYPRLNERVEI